MTVPRPTAHSTISRDGELDALFNLAVAFVQANQDASCSGLQRHFRIGYSLALQLQKRLEDNGALVGIESLVEPAGVIIRVIEQVDRPALAIIELIKVTAPLVGITRVPMCLWKKFWRRCGGIFCSK